MIFFPDRDASEADFPANGTLYLDRREIVCVAFAAYLDEHALLRADQALQPIGTSFGGSLSQASGTGFHDFAH